VRQKATLHWLTGMLGVIALLMPTIAISQKRKPGKSGAEENKPQVDVKLPIAEARQQIVEAMNSLANWNGELTYGDVQVTDQQLSYSVSWKHEAIGRKLAGKEGERSYLFNNIPHFNPPEHHWGGYWSVNLDVNTKDVLFWKDQSTAEKFVVAMNRMIWENSPGAKAQRQAEQQAYEQTVTAWRSAGSKVELPEEAERHKVLALAAFGDKDFQRAADEYIAGLKVYPMWPEGEFNVALLFGDSLHRYSDAVQHMNHYLELMPNAPNAEDAKHKLWIWQDRESRQ
jgi:TolA-binding protein